jgi:hypothetical protein
MGTKIASGVFSWGGEERRTRRYGLVGVDEANFDRNERCGVVLDKPAIKAFARKKVRMWAVVTKVRKSGHIGDMFLRILPETPEVGERVDLGVGIFTSDHADWSYKDGTPVQVFGLKPGDGRATLWMDPHKLYRLHDQTVDVFVEETTDADHPVPVIQVHEQDGAISTGDGYFQVAGPMPTRVRPHIERVEGLKGAFIMGGLAPFGTRVEVVETQKNVLGED